MQVVVNGFYAREGKTCLRADANLYSGKFREERDGEEEEEEKEREKEFIH